MKKHLNTLNKVCEDFKWYYDKGFITTRDGNAAFYQDSDYVVTASGARKDNLTLLDFVSVSARGNSLDKTQTKPSIETAAHIAAQMATDKEASIHVHSPNTVALFLLFEEWRGIGTGSLEEALNKKWPELFRYTKIGLTVPFLEPGSDALHQAISQSFRVDKPDLVVMQRHGIITVGDNFDKCKEHILRTEHISSILLKTLSASGGKLEKIL